MAAILGFMPLLDLRFNIPIKSGSAANVVPNPATKPTISERLKTGEKQTLCIVDGQFPASCKEHHTANIK